MNAPRPALPAIESRVEVDGLPGGTSMSIVLAVDGALLCLDRPVIGGRTIDAARGRVVTIAYAVRDIPHSATLRVEDAPPKARHDGIWARLTGEPVRNQRRRGFRVHLTVPVIARAVDDENEPIGDPVEMTTVELSTVGLQAMVEEPLETGTRLVLLLSLPGRKDPLSILAHVQREIMSSADQASRHRLGIEFEDLEPADQEQLRRVLLEGQRAQRRRELGLN